jgi:hypothetical protein
VGAVRGHLLDRLAAASGLGRRRRITEAQGKKIVQLGITHE